MKLITVFAFVTVIFLASDAAYAQNGTYGVRTIKKDNDTINLQQKIATILSLDADVFESASYTGKNTVPIKYRLLRPAKDKKTTRKLLGCCTLTILKCLAVSAVAGEEQYGGSKRLA